MKSILFVCTGNTCRSPMAVGLWEDKAEKYHLDIKAESCGIMAAEGACASMNALTAMKNAGIDISSHRARMISGDITGHAGLILTMTKAHRDAVAAYFPEHSHKVYTLYEYAQAVQGNISDPFGGSLLEYEACRDEIDKLLENIIKKDKTIE